jgi:hypothetical protein
MRVALNSVISRYVNINRLCERTFGTVILPAATGPHLVPSYCLLRLVLPISVKKAQISFNYIVHFRLIFGLLNLTF